MLWDFCGEIKTLLGIIQVNANKMSIGVKLYINEQINKPRGSSGLNCFCSLMTSLKLQTFAHLFSRYIFFLCKAKFCLLNKFCLLIKFCSEKPILNEQSDSLIVLALTTKRSKNCFYRIWLILISEKRLRKDSANKAVFVSRTTDNCSLRESSCSFLYTY